MYIDYVKYFCEPVIVLNSISGGFCRQILCIATIDRTYLVLIYVETGLAPTFRSYKL